MALADASRFDFSTPLPGSILRYNAEYGAQKVIADDTSMIVSFININGVTIDEQMFLKINNAPEFIGDTIIETAATEDCIYLNSIAGHASDPDGDKPNLFHHLRSNMVKSVASNGLLSGTPDNEDVGLNSWILEVEDERFGTDQAILQITVLNTNDNPVFSGDTIVETAATEDSYIL